MDGEICSQPKLPEVPTRKNEKWSLPPQRDRSTTDIWVWWDMVLELWPAMEEMANQDWDPSSSHWQNRPWSAGFTGSHFWNIHLLGVAVWEPIQPPTRSFTAGPLAWECGGFPALRGSSTAEICFGAIWLWSLWESCLQAAVPESAGAYLLQLLTISHTTSPCRRLMTAHLAIYVLICCVNRCFTVVH